MFENESSPVLRIHWHLTFMWCLNRMPVLILLNLNERFCMIRQIKLTLGRKHSSFSSTPSPMNFLSLKSDFVYLKFYWSGHTVLIICRNEQTSIFKHIFKICWFIDKTTAKVILVWNFDLRIFSVYGHGATSMMGKLLQTSWAVGFNDILQIWDRVTQDRNDPGNVTL